MSEGPLRIAILEDDAPRRDAMVARLTERFPFYPVRCFANSQDFIAELSRTGCGDLFLISLDHDLVAPPDEVDPGSGRDVTDWLVRQSPCCPVIVHSSNADAAVGMIRELRDHDWTTHRVVPCDDLAWIDDAWFPEARGVLVETGKSRQREFTA